MKIVALERARSALEVAAPLMEGVPIAGGVLKGGLEATSRILRYAEEVKSNKEKTHALADDAAKWFLTLVNTLNEVQANPTELERLQGHARDILRHLEAIADATWKWSRQRLSVRVWKKADHLAEINKLREELQHSYERFVAASHIRISAEVAAVRSIVEVAQSDVAEIRSSVRLVLSDFERAALDLLQPVHAARFDSSESPKGCLADTRREILHTLLEWACHPSSNLAVYWLAGLAGTGKSTIAKTFCVQINQQVRDIHVITFFVSKNSSEQQDAQRILHTLLYQLARTHTPFGILLAEALRRRPEIRKRPLQDQVKTLMVDLLNECSALDFPLPLILFVIDALDECFATNKNEGGASLLLEILKSFRRFPFKLLITTRMDNSISRAFSQVQKDSLRLHEIEHTQIAYDVKLILTNGFTQIATKFLLDVGSWPSQEDIDVLTGRTGYLIIFATTVLAYIGDERASQPEQRLKNIMDQAPLTHGSTSPYTEIDHLYMDILLSSARNSHAMVDTQLCHRIRSLLATVSFVSEPLSASSLAAIIGVHEREVEADIRSLAAVLLIEHSGEPSSFTGLIRMFHPSLRDFLLDRCSDPLFAIERTWNCFLATRCLQLLSKYLRQNICNIASPVIANDDVEGPDLATRLQAYVSDVLRYTCIHWLGHLTSVENPDLDLVQALCAFTSQHLIHWLELVSLLSLLPQASNALVSVINWCQRTMFTGVDHVRILLEDTLQMIHMYETALGTHALQIYASALVTMPDCSLRSASLVACLSSSTYFPSEQDIYWPALQDVMSWSNDRLHSQGHWHDGANNLSGISDHSLEPLHIHSSTSIAEPAGQGNAKAGHSSRVLCVAFSPDSARYASGSLDGAIQYWDSLNGAKLAELNGHHDAVHSVKFSADCREIVSSSRDQTVRLWHTLSGKEIARFVHLYPVHDAALSIDGTHLVSGCSDGVLRLWDKHSRTEITSFRGHTSAAHRVSFSPDGAKIVSGSDDNTIRIWDIRSGAQIAQLSGHTFPIGCFVVSPDGTRKISTTSGSDDDSLQHVHLHSVKSVDSALAQIDSTPNSSTINSFAVVGGSLPSQRLELWDTSNAPINAQSPGYVTYAEVPALPFDVARMSPALLDDIPHDKGNRHINGRTTIWTLDAHEDFLECIALSHDGTKIASGSRDTSIRVWDLNTGNMISVLRGHRQWVRCLTYSHDDTQIVSGSDDKTVRLWKTINGAETVIMEGHNYGVCCVAMSRDGAKIVSGSGDHDTVRLWDALTGASIAVFVGPSFWVSCVAFSPDGSKIASGSRSESIIRLWDASTGAEIRNCGTRGLLPVQHLSFSEDAGNIHGQYQNGEVLSWDLTVSAPVPSIGKTNSTSSDSALHQTPDQLISCNFNTGWVTLHRRHGSSIPFFWIPRRLRGYHQVGTLNTLAILGEAGGMQRITVLNFSKLLANL